MSKRLERGGHGHGDLGPLFLQRIDFGVLGLTLIFEGLAVDDSEKKRLQDDLGDTNHMLLPNHGGLTLGPTVGDAFMRFYDLQRACEI